jgi:hypothetical protein
VVSNHLAEGHVEFVPKPDVFQSGTVPNPMLLQDGHQRVVVVLAGDLSESKPGCFFFFFTPLRGRGRPSSLRTVARYAYVALTVQVGDQRSTKPRTTTQALKSKNCLLQGCGFRPKPN